MKNIVKSVSLIGLLLGCVLPQNVQTESSINRDAILEQIVNERIEAKHYAVYLKTIQPQLNQLKSKQAQLDHDLEESSPSIVLAAMLVGPSLIFFTAISVGLGLQSLNHLYYKIKLKNKSVTEFIKNNPHSKIDENVYKRNLYKAKNSSYSKILLMLGFSILGSSMFMSMTYRLTKGIFTMPDRRSLLDERGLTCKQIKDLYDDAPSLNR